MLKQKDFPTVLFDDNGSFTDISLSMLDYATDPSTITTFVAADDRFLFGRVKPFDIFFIELATVNTQSTKMSVKFFDKDTQVFKTATNQIDETNGLTRSGFVQWKNPNTSTDTEWGSTTINGKKLFWIEVTFDNDLSASMALQGWNIVFSDDRDIDAVYKNVSSYFPSSLTSGVLYHQTARNLIIQEIRNDGQFKIEHGSLKNTSFNAQIIAWDLMEAEEVNLWSTYLALSLIFDNVSTNPDDKFDQLSQKYALRGDHAKQTFYLTLDKDDDGTEDRQELLGTEHGAPVANLLRRG